MLQKVEEAEEEISVVDWNYAKDIEPKPELKKLEFTEAEFTEAVKRVWEEMNRNLGE